MDMISIIELIIMSGLGVSIVGIAFRLGHKDQKVNEHDTKLKEHDNEIKELKDCNNDVKLHLASIETNILWIKEKLSEKE